MLTHAYVIAWFYITIRWIARGLRFKLAVQFLRKFLFRFAIAIVLVWFILASLVAIMHTAELISRQLNSAGEAGDRVAVYELLSAAAVYPGGFEPSSSHRPVTVLPTRLTER